MQLVVFGATGRTGRHIVHQALAAGHAVTAFVRRRARLAEADIPQGDPNLSVVEGDVQKAEDVRRAVEGADAVLLALGHTKSSEDDILATGTRHVLEAMDAAGVRRLVVETGAGVADPRDEAPGLGGRFMSGLVRLLAPALVRDAEAQAELVRASDVDWTLVRATRLTHGPHTGTYRTGYMDLGAGTKIARADVADFMLRLAVEGGFEREAPKVTS